MSDSNSEANKYSESKRAPARLAAQPGPTVEHLPAFPPIGDLLTALMAQRDLEVKLRAQVDRENNYHYHSAAVPRFTDFGYTVTDMLIDAATSGVILQVPPAMCVELGQQVLPLRKLDKSVTEWAIKTSAVTGTRGYCWFSSPIPIYSVHSGTVVQLVALTWNVCDRKDPDSDGESAPEKVVRLTGMARTAEHWYGEPKVIADDWPLGISYAEFVRRRTLLCRPGPGRAGGATRGMVLMCIFALLCQSTLSPDNPTWGPSRVAIPDTLPDSYKDLRDRLQNVVTFISKMHTPDAG